MFSNNMFSKFAPVNFEAFTNSTQSVEHFANSYTKLDKIGFNNYKFSMKIYDRCY